jgi:hypothetical protein
MLYVNVTRLAEDGTLLTAQIVSGDAVAVLRAKFPRNLETRNNWHTFEAAKEVAAKLGPGFIATDAGPHVSPRYDVIALPKVGDLVSYAFNGDSYPCGEIASISKSLKVIVTTEGQKFYRVRETGAWRYNRTWSLQAGHVYKQNPEF